MRIFSKLVFSLVLLASVAEARGSVPALFGYGARGSAMAGTVTATAAGHEAVYYNPAGLAFAKHPSFAVGYQLGEFFLEIDGREVDVQSAPALVIGFDVPLPFKGPLAERLTVGFGFVLPQNAILVADIPRPGAPRFVRLGSRAQTVSLMGGLGVRVSEGLGLGVGFIALSELRGAIDVAPNDARRIGTTVKDELVADYALIAGVAWRPFDALSLGLVFRDESSAQFALPITAELGDQFPVMIPRLDVQGTAQYDPLQVALAGAYTVTPWLLVSGTAVYERWSAMENPIVFTAVPDSFPEQPSPNFSDIISVRAGAELNTDLGELRILPRAGLALEPTPVPEQRGFHNYLDNTRVIVAGGAGLRWRGLKLDLALQWHLLAARTDVKDPALVAEVPPLTPSERPRTGPTVSHAGSIFAAGLELGIEL